MGSSSYRTGSAPGDHAGGGRAPRHVRAPAGGPPGPAVARASGRPRCWHAARAGRRPLTPTVKSGGCTAPAAGPRSRSPTSRGPCWPRWPAATRHVCYSRPGPGEVPGRDYQTAGRLSGVRAGRPRPARATPTPTSAARPRSWRRSPPPCWPWASTATACTPRSSAPRPAITPGIAAAPPGRRTRPPGRPATGPEVSFARSGLTVRWEPRLRQPARTGRGLRRPGPLVVPDRRVPHLRDRPAVRNGRLPSQTR